MLTSKHEEITFCQAIIFVFITYFICLTFAKNVKSGGLEGVSIEGGRLKPSVHYVPRGAAMVGADGKA